MGLILVGGMVGAARVDAASLTLDWAAPTTNADGTRLTDLGSYRIYLGTSSPACPSASFFTVASPTSSPASGQTLSRVVSSLSAGTTYFARVTAVDTSGNESTCSAAASGVAKADFSVTPSTTTSFGSVAVGTTVDRAFTVQNTSTISLSGTASTGAPYSIQSGGSFSLAAGASQTVTVRFRPTSSGTFAGNVNFVAGGDSISRALTGSGTGSALATVTLSVTKNGSGSGTVTGTPAGINCGATCSQSVTAGTALTLAATPAAGSTFVGWSGACSGTGTCAVTVNAGTTVTATFNLAAAPSSAQDTFNRPNEIPLGGSWTSNGFTLVANHAQPQSFASDADAFWKAPTPWPANQWMQAKLTITGTGGQTQGIGFAARNQGNKTYYRFVVDHAASNNVNFSRFNNAARTNLGSCTHTWTDGATWKFQVTTVGATVKLQAFRDGVQVCGDILDTAPQQLLSGQPGIAFSSNAVSASLDDWAAGGL